MRPLICSVGLILVLAACTSPAAAPTPTAAPTLTATPPVTPASTATPSPTPAPALSAPSGTTDETETLRQLVFDYWDALNSYDVEKVLSYLEENYRSDRESTIRSDMGQLKTFGVKLEVSELTPPQMSGPDEGEMFLMMKEPLGIRRIRMAWVRGDGEWKITYSQEVE